MSKDILQTYINNKIVEKNDTGYIIKLGDQDVFLHKRKDYAEKALIENIEEGKVADLTCGEPVPVKDDKKEQAQQTEEPEKTPSSDLETKESNGLETITPENQNKKESNLSEEEELYLQSLEQMSGKLGNIKQRGKAGKFEVFVLGVSTKSVNHPVIKSHPYVYRHCISTKNVKSGSTILNDGWTVLSKADIKPDPRTGKKWLSVAHDDSPEEDFFTIGKTILCYASRKDFNEKKGELVIGNINRVAKTLDKRQEESYKAAAVSDQNVESSLSVYTESNRASQSQEKENLIRNEGMSESQAISEIDRKINQAKSGLKNHKTVKAVQKIDLNSI
jgi:hypothetical protein